MEYSNLYGCKNKEEAKVMVRESWSDDVDSNEFTAYFGDYSKGIECFKRWINYRGHMIEVRLYLRIDTDWTGVSYKCITKDNKDHTEDLLK